MGVMSKKCWNEFPNFKPSEFKCSCGCEQEYIKMDCNLIRLLQRTRNHFKKSITITCGHRCKKYNNSLVAKGWAVSNSVHVDQSDGDVRAADIVITGYTSLQKRLEVIKYLKEQPEYDFAYHYNPASSSARERTCKNMGNAIHIQVKK